MTTIDRPIVPRAALIGAAALIAANLLLVAGHQVATTLWPAPAPDPATAVQPVAVRELAFVATPDGAIHALDAPSGQTIGTLRDTDGFVRVILQAFAFDRGRRDVAEVPVYRLTRWPGGRLTIEDRTTGIVINLGAFGEENKSRFVRFIADLEPQS